MNSKIAAFILVLFTTAVHAGTMTCVQTANRQIGNPGAIVSIVAGSCTFSNSYATGGEIFSGPGTDLENASQSLCGSSYATIAVVLANGASTTTSTTAILNTYNYTTGKVQAFYPTRTSVVVPAVTAPGTYTVNKPTFTVTKGAILAGTELGLSADATTATVNNNTIAVTLALEVGNTPVGAQTVTVTADPVYSVTTASNSAIEVTAATDVSMTTMYFAAICF